MEVNSDNKLFIYLLLKIIEKYCHTEIKKQLIYKIEKNNVKIGIRYEILDEIIFYYKGRLNYKNKENLEKIIKMLEDDNYKEVKEV